MEQRLDQDGGRQGYGEQNTPSISSWGESLRPDTLGYIDWNIQMGAAGSDIKPSRQSPERYPCIRVESGRLVSLEGIDTEDEEGAVNGLVEFAHGGIPAYQEGEAGKAKFEGDIEELTRRIVHLVRLEGQNGALKTRDDTINPLPTAICVYESCMNIRQTHQMSGQRIVTTTIIPYNLEESDAGKLCCISRLMVHDPDSKLVGTQADAVIERPIDYRGAFSPEAAYRYMRRIQVALVRLFHEKSVADEQSQLEVTVGEPRAA